MANTKQAKKRARQAEDHRQRNIGQRSELRTSIKKVIKAIETVGADARAELKSAESVIDHMARKGHIHKNKAARHKSRLSARIKAQSMAAQASA